MASLILYGSNVLDTTSLTTASVMSTTTGGSETSTITTLTGSAAYGEIWSQGNAGLATVASIPTTPTGHGWIYYPGAGTFDAGTWSAQIRISSTAWGGAGHTAVTMRLSKYSSGSYTLIGTLTANITGTAETLYTLTGSSMGAVTTNPSDGIYVELWWWDDNPDAAGDNPRTYMSVSPGVGVADEVEVTTTNFLAGSTTAALTIYGSNALEGGGTLLTACEVARRTGGGQTTAQTVFINNHVYGEIWSRGNASLSTVDAIPATPTGHGWIFYPGTGTFSVGNWSAIVNLACAKYSSGGHTTATMRFFRYHASSYTSIGTITTTITSTAKTQYTFSSTSMPSVTIGKGEGIYIDLWWKDNNSYAVGDNPTIHLSNSGVSGYANYMQITTAAFTPEPVDHPVWGVTSGLWGYTSYLSPRDVSWAVSMGLECYRIQCEAIFIWLNYSDPPSAWSWNQLDDAIYQIQQAGLCPIHTVNHPRAKPTPDPWYLATSEPFYMDDAENMATYARAVAERYNGQQDCISNGINYGRLTLYSFEMGNENANIHYTPENASPPWIGYHNSPYSMYNGTAGVTGAHPAQPARDPYYWIPVAQQCAAAIREVNQTVRIGMCAMYWMHPGGGPFTSGGTRGNGRSNFHNFLDALYQAGGVMDLLSYINFHYYTSGQDPTVGSGQTVTIATALSDMIEVMNANGDTTLPIWVTEFNQTIPSVGGSEALQSQYNLAVVDALIACGRAETIIFYTLNDLNLPVTNDASWIWNDGSAWHQRQIYDDFRGRMAANPTLYLPPTPMERSISGVSSALKAIGVARPISGISASLGGVAIPLTVLLANANSTTLPTTAKKLYSIVGVSNASNSYRDSQYNAVGATGYFECWSQGTTGAESSSGTLPAPTDHGFLWDVTTLEGQYLLAGSYTPTLRFTSLSGSGIAGGSQTINIICRLSKRTSAGVYTTIATSTLTGRSLSGTATTFNLPAASGAQTGFTTGDKLYLDVWVNVTANTGGWGIRLTRLSVDATGLTGDPNAQVVTPGYQVTGGYVTFTHDIINISATVTITGGIRPITGVSASVGVSASTYTRTLTGVSTALKVLDVPRSLVSVSAATKAFGVPRQSSSISAALGSGLAPLSVYVSGLPVEVQQAGISFDQRLDDRAGGSFVVVDETGTQYPLQERQQVEVLDTVRSLVLYRGFIDSIGEQALSPSQTNSALIRTATLEDLRALAEKRQCVADYTNWTAGNLAAELVRTRLSGEQITANFAMRRDHDATSFGQGTLSGMQATHGYLELAQAGSDITRVETTTSNFAGGTLSGVTATNNSLRLTSYKAMRFSAYAGGSTGVNAGNYLSYWSIWQGAITINNDDYIDYYIWHSSESVEAVGGVDIVCSDGTTLRDTHVYDQNAGIDTHPNASLQGYATDRWYYRKIGFPAYMNGRSIKNAVLAMEGDKEGYHCFYVRALKLHSVGGTVRATFFDTSIQRIGFMRQIGYYKPWIILRDVYAGYGSRTAPSLSLNSAGIAGQSVISWSETDTTQSTGTGTGVSTEDRPKQVVVDTSIDGGDTWQVCENGKPIPSLPVGMDLTNKSMLVRQTLNVGGSNPELSPTLNECTLAVEAAYNSSKVDVSRSYAGSEMTDGTNTLCGYQAAINTTDGPEYNDVSGLKMNGWRKNWKTGERVNHILYGEGVPFMGVQNGCLFLTATPLGGDVHVRLSDAGTYTSLIIEAMVFPPSNGNAGLLYATTYWGNTPNSFGYYAYISTAEIGLGKGANANSNTYTELATAVISLEADSWHQLRIVCNSSDHVHHVFLDDIELITHTDSSYTTGGVGLRMWAANNLRLGFWDAFGVSSNTALAQASRTAPSVSLSAAGSVGDSRIWWTEDIPGSTLIDVQTSIDGGSNYTSCTNGETIPVLTSGLSLSGKSLLVKILLSSDSVAYTPTLLGISWQVVGAFSASGSRISPVLDIDNAGTVGSSSVSWDADVPSGGTLGVDSSLNGSSWSTLSTSGDSVIGLTEQDACWWDTFDTDTHANYTYTVGHWSWDTANSRLVTQSTTDTLLKSAISTGDVEVMLISDRMDSLHIRLRNGANGYYDLQLSDNSGVGGPQLDFVRYTPGGGTVTLHTDHTRTMTRGNYHVIRVILTGGSYVVWFNGTRAYMGTDSSPIAGSGQIGLWFNAGTSYIRDLAIRPLGQDATGVNVYTRVRMTSTDPLSSPKVKDLVACVRNPFIATGNTIPQTDWAYKKSVAEALDECAQTSSMGWRFNESYQLVMQPRDGQFAPFVLWQGDNGTVDGTTLPKVQWQSSTYRNRQYVRGAVNLVEQAESKLGNGVDTSWTLIYPIESIESVLLNGQSVSVGIKDTDTGQTFSYVPKEKTITFETRDGANAPPNTRIDITYIARVDYVAMAEDVAQQSIVAVLEGSTGIVEASESIDGLSRDAADVLAAARIAEHARLALTLSLTTRTGGLVPGQLVTVVLPKHDLLDLQLLITGVSTQVRQQPDGTLIYWYALETTTGPSLGSWARALSLQMIQKGGLSP